jgi:3-phosphoshikimate 1-carboxyvinyltransferase
LTDIKIEPKKLTGEVTVPPSKSMAHRAVICAGLANGRSVIKNIQLSDDIRATIEGMRAFGAIILQEKDTLIIDGVGSSAERRSHEIDCNESGSTLRFFVPLATLFEGKTRFIGRGKLGQRPLNSYQEIFEEQGLRYEAEDSEQLNLTVEGSLKPGDYHMPGDISSQFITGMLLTLPQLEGDSTLTLTTELESKGYVDLTLSILEDFGVKIEHDAQYKQFNIQGNQEYSPIEYTVEGDYSQAAFWLSAKRLGSKVEVAGLRGDSLQGDQEILAILETLSDESLQERIIDGSQVPDIIPVVALVACLSSGKTKIKNLERLRIKESDRLEATQKELSKLGAEIEIKGDALHISGTSRLKGDQEVWSHKDHRMAMMLAIASTVCEKAIVLKDAEVVTKSYPNFWEEFNKLR